MKITGLSRFIIAGCAIILLSLGATPAQAQSREVKFEKYGFAITPPDGWEQRDGPANTDADVPAVFVKPNNSQILMVLIDNHRTVNVPVNEAFIRDFDKSVDEASRQKKQWSRIVQIHGITAYERLSSGDIQGRQGSVLSIVIPANHKLYSVQAMNFDGNDADTPELLAGVTSFRFLTPPQLAAVAVVQDAGSFRDDPVQFIKSRLKQAGPGGMAGIAVLGVLLLIIAIRIFRRKAPPAFDSETLVASQPIAPRKPAPPPASVPRTTPSSASPPQPSSLPPRDPPASSQPSSLPPWLAD